MYIYFLFTTFENTISSSSSDETTLPNTSLLCPSLLADKQDLSKGLTLFPGLSWDFLDLLESAVENRDNVSFSNVSVTDTDAERSWIFERPENSVRSGRTEVAFVLRLDAIDEALLFANEKRRFGEALRLSIAAFVPL